MDKIDFVITWVDGNDPEWQAEKAKYKGVVDGDQRINRYRDWDNLRYWFRGIEKFAPWVNKIYFVTWGHQPNWLNTENEKLVIVNHKDFIPEEYLPTFSCRPIELNLHRIAGLSEQFVYFNDDMFLIDGVQPEDFFKNGKPCDAAILDAIVFTALGKSNERLSLDSLYITPAMNTAIINRNFNKKNAIKNNWRLWFSLKNGKDLMKTLLLLPWKEFTGIKNQHLPYSYVKKTFEELWEKEPEALNAACEHKFRKTTDVSSRLFSYWQVVKGYIEPRSPKIGKLYSITSDSNMTNIIKKVISNQAYKMICINDEYDGDDYEAVRDIINAAFQSILENKSSFET